MPGLSGRRPTSQARLLLWASLAAGAATVLLARRLDTAALIYNAPIALPFAAFWLDRLADERQRGCWAVDAAVTAFALLRAVTPVPGYSGHVLFTAYATLTGHGWALRGVAALVLAQVLWLKWQWGDARTPVGGLWLAAAGVALRAACASRAARLSRALG